jgi:S-adenosylmethionine:tRNA ribosyltransferase-isomerase
VRPETGGRAEVLLLEPAAGGTWWALARPARRLRRGCQLRLSDGTRVTIVEEGAAGQRRLQFPSSQSAEQVARRCGEMPLPPYLRRPAAPTDSEDYQTVYARVDGSIAAPTAGLHFTNDLLARLQEQGIDLVDVVLHVGLGTFEPLRGADPLQHSMHRESIEVPADLPARLAKVRASSGRIVAVGTTVARVLESLALWQEDPNDQRVALEPRGAVLSGSTRIFLHPPYEFRLVDILITNFHLPRSTLLLLVAAFAGLDAWKRVYAHAIDKRFRFFSYGDATYWERPNRQSQARGG